jgi:hypothetical protein
LRRTHQVAVIGLLTKPPQPGDPIHSFANRRAELFVSRHSGMVRLHRNLEIPGSMLRIAPE